MPLITLFCHHPLSARQSDADDDPYTARIREEGSSPTGFLKAVCGCCCTVTVPLLVALVVVLYFTQPYAGGFFMLSTLHRLIVFKESLVGSALAEGACARA